MVKKGCKVGYGEVTKCMYEDAVWGICIKEGKVKEIVQDKSMWYVWIKIRKSSGRNSGGRSSSSNTTVKEMPHKMHRLRQTKQRVKQTDPYLAKLVHMSVILRTIVCCPSSRSPGRWKR